MEVRVCSWSLSQGWGGLHYKVNSQKWDFCWNQRAGIMNQTASLNTISYFFLKLELWWSLLGWAPRCSYMSYIWLNLISTNRRWEFTFTMTKKGSRRVSAAKCLLLSSASLQARCYLNTSRVVNVFWESGHYSRLITSPYHPTRWRNEHSLSVKYPSMPWEVADLLETMKS